MTNVRLRASATPKCTCLVAQNKSQSVLGNRALISKSISSVALVCLTFLASRLLPETAFPPVAAATTQEKAPDPDVPAYHHDPPAESLPPVLDAKEFDKTVVQNAYRLAGQVKSVLYQQPCYCHCDRHHGHTSLFDCYATKHTAGCGTCLQELFYIYEQTKKGQSPEQIREAIVRGEWKNVDLKKYDKPLSTNEQTGRRESGDKPAMARSPLP
jgi:Protein of unknown function with PCYCGC motif